MLERNQLTGQRIHRELLGLRNREKLLALEILEKIQLMEQGRKYLGLGYSSLFDYLVRGLGYSESAAYQKQSCLRLTQELPEIQQKIETGALTPTGLSMAYKQLRKKNRHQKRQLIRKLENQNLRSIKKILSEQEVAPPIKIQKTEYQDKVILRLELSKEQNLKLERLRSLLSHQGPVEHLIEKLINRELKKYSTPAKESKAINSSKPPRKSHNPRYIQKKLRNHLLEKAQFKCQQPNCEQTHLLQVDHIKPVRKGGLATVENLQILCSAHNRWKG